MGWWEDGFPAPSRPIRVEGGIRVRSKRGAIGESWWSRRFLGVLESLGMGGRLTRGKTYARAGQVIDLEVTAGSVAATVQGSRAKPYRVSVGTRRIAREQWERIERRLAAEALFGAKLLAGEMPPDLDEVFGDEGVALFPASASDLTMRCNCPDEAVPCKHLAATLYVFAEALDDDPFLLLAWRGRERDHVLANLRRLRGSSGEDGSTGGDITDLSAVLGGDHADPETSVEHFWNGPSREVPDGPHSSEDGPGEHTELPTPAAGSGEGLLRHLGEPDVRVRGRNLADLLGPAYRALTGRPPS